MNSKPPSFQPAKPCYNPKLAPSRAAPSPLYLILQSLSALPTFFGSSSSIVSVGTSHSQHILAGAVALFAQSGGLRARGHPFQRAATRICREGGARVNTNSRLADLNVQNVSRVDDRRIEVIANGLPILGGSRLAVDITLVAPLTTTGEPRARGRTYAGAP